MDDQPIKEDPKGFYEILGLTKDSSQNEIRKAYKKAALLYHPDKNVDNRDEATQKFKQISEAYSILGDEEKRELYDRGNEDESLYFQEEAKCTCPNCGRPRDFDPFDFVEFFFGLKEHIQNLVNSDEYDSDEYEEDYSSEDSRYYNENMHKPDKPKKPQCIFVNGRVKVTWIENNTRADYFKLYMKTNKKNSVPVCINENELDSGENCYYIQGLNPGTYFFCVAGVNDAGEGEQSMWTDLVVPSHQKGNNSKDKKKKKSKKNKTVNFEKELKTAVEEEDFEKVYELYPSVNRYPSLNKTLVNQVELIMKNRKKEKEIRDLVNKYKETLYSCIKSQSLLDLRKVINAIENNSKLEKYFVDDLPKAKEVLEKIELENLEKIKEKEMEKQKEKEEKEKYLKESQQKKREEKEIKKKRYQEEQQRLEKERKMQEEKERREKEKMNRKNKNNSSNNKDNHKENNQPQKNPKDIKKNKENKEINKDNNNQSKSKSKEEKKNGINNQQNGVHKQNGVHNIQDSKNHKQSHDPQQHEQSIPKNKSNHVKSHKNNGENHHNENPNHNVTPNLHIGPKINLGANLDNKDSLFGQQRVNLNNNLNHLHQQQLNTNNVNGMHQNMNTTGLINGSSHNPHLNPNFNLNLSNLNNMDPSFNNHGMEPNFNLHNNNNMSNNNMSNMNNNNNMNNNMDPNFNNHVHTNNSFHNPNNPVNNNISPNSSSRPFLFNPNPNNVHSNGIWSFNNEMHNPNVNNVHNNVHGNNIHGNVHNNHNIHNNNNNNMNIPNTTSFFNPNIPSNTPNHSKLNSFLFEQQPNGSSDLPLHSPYFYNNPFSFSGFPSSNPLFFNPNGSFPVSNNTQPNFFPQQNNNNNIPQQSFFQPSLSSNSPFYENNLFFNPNKPFDKNPSNL